MKKNLCIVLGLVFLLYTFASCEPEDEPGALKTYDSPITISEKDQIELEPHSYDKEQIEEESCDEIESTTLYAGQDTEVGWVHISNSKDEIFVTYDLKHTSWSLQETHLFVGTEQDIPYNKSGNPKIGHFQYHAQQDNANEKEYTCKVPIGDLEGCPVIIAHAVVVNDTDARNTETAFGYGHENVFPGSRWGWFIDFCLQECDDMDEDGDNQEGTGSNGENGSEEAQESASGSGGTSSDTSGQGPQGGTDDGSYPGFNDANADCLVSYAFNASNQSDSRCFLSDGLDQWGWTNQLFYSQQMNYVTGYEQSFPLLASAFQCDISNSLEVGYVKVKVTGGDGRFFADIEVRINDTTYDLDEFDLFVGTDRYPLDNSQNRTILPEFFTYRESSLGTKYYSLSSVPWPSNANFIARAVICPAN